MEIFSQSSSKSQGVEVEPRPGSITELSPDYRQIEKPVQHLKVDHLYLRSSDLKDSCFTSDRELDVQSPPHSLFCLHVKVPLSGEMSMSDQLSFKSQ